jgi:hypothetical protein
MEIKIRLLKNLDVNTNIMEKIIIISLFLTWVIGFIFINFFDDRLIKVKRYREKLIDFCSSDMTKFDDRFYWFDNELPTYENMVWSLKPIRSMIVGKYKDEFLKYYDGRK